MGFTVTTLTVGHAQPRRLVTAVDYDRTVEISVAGAAAVWLGHDDVTPGRGRQLVAGDDPYLYTDGDELFAVAWSATSVTVVETT